MTDCLNTLYSGVRNHRLADKSTIYNNVRQAAQLDSALPDVKALDRPDLGRLKFSIDIGAAAAARLQDPRYNSPTSPVASLSRPSLESVTYEAAQSVIDFEHSSPVLGDITYLDGLDQISLPDDSPGAPPLDYPQQGLQTLPPGPGDQTTTAPTFSIGDKPTMLGVNRIDFTPSGISPIDLSDLMPEYDPPDVSELDWQEELRYEDDEVFRSKLQGLMQGDDEIAHWIGSTVQAKLHTSDIRELARRTKTQLDEIMDQTAGRNFSLPHGPAEAAVLAEAGRELEDSYKAAQKVRDEVYEAAMNTLAEAIGQSLAVERYHFALYLRYVRQNLRVYQLNLELATQAYNALVEVYGRLESAVRTRVDAYNQYVRAITSENQALASQVEFTEAEVATYRARVEMFSADVSLRQKSAQVRGADVRQQTFILDEYQSELRGTMANLQIVQRNVEAFQEAIRAYSNHTQWYDEAIGAYETSVEATASKISVDGAKFDAYRRLWGAEGDRMGAFREYLQASTSAMDAELQNYRSAVGAQQQYFNSVIDSLSSSLQAAGGYAEAAGQIAGHAGDYNAAKVSYTSAQNDVNVADGTTAMAQDTVAAEAAAQYARLDAAREAAQVTAAGALAQAASAIFQVGLSASGASSHRVSGRDSGSERFSAQDRKSFSKVCTYVERPMTL